MKKAITMTLSLAALTLFANFASADLLCGEATYNCVNASNGALLIVNKRAVRFCTINSGSSKEELLLKLTYFEQCNSLGGQVVTSDMNK